MWTASDNTAQKHHDRLRENLIANVDRIVLDCTSKTYNPETDEYEPTWISTIQKIIDKAK